MRVGIVSSWRRPADPFRWLHYHVRKGITAFYIMLEDTPELPRAIRTYGDELATQYGKAVKIHTETRAVDRAAEDNYHDLQGRQAAWVDRAIDLARADGVQWLFHIDDDEILHPGDAANPSDWGTVLAAVPPSCDAVHLTNLEAFAPANIAGPFLMDHGVRFLPRGCAHLYSAYTNGKAGVRTAAPNMHAAGPHNFGGGNQCELPESTAFVAHYDGMAMGPDDVPPAKWVEKHRLRVGGDMSRVPFAATKDAVAALSAGASRDALADIWSKYRSQTGDQFAACTLPSVRVVVAEETPRRK